MHTRVYVYFNCLNCLLQLVESLASSRHLADDALPAAGRAGPNALTNPVLFPGSSDLPSMSSLGPHATWRIASRDTTPPAPGTLSSKKKKKTNSSHQVHLPCAVAACRVNAVDGMLVRVSIRAVCPTYANYLFWEKNDRPPLQSSGARLFCKTAAAKECTIS